VYPEDLPSVVMQGTEYSAASVIHALNYGTHPFAEINKDPSNFTKLTILYAIWDDALLEKANIIFWGRNYSEDPTACIRQSNLDKWLRKDGIKLLRSMLLRCPKVGSLGQRVFPILHFVEGLRVVIDMCLKSVREGSYDCLFSRDDFLMLWAKQVGGRPCL
jgi:hypothetical protein